MGASVPRYEANVCALADRAESVRPLRPAASRLYGWKLERQFLAPPCLNN